MSALGLDRCTAAFGRRVSLLAAAAVGLGVLALVTGWVLGLQRPLLGMLAAAWLFSAGLAAGGVAVAAALRLGHSRWAEGALPVAHATAGFFAPAFVLLALVVLAARLWMPAGAVPAGHLAPLAARDLVATAVLFGVGHWYVAATRAADSTRASRLAVLYLILYAGTLSLWAADLVMGLRDWAPSTVVPAYYFMGAFLSAIAWIALCSAAGTHAPVDVRHDLGKLVFAFATFWAYLLWSAYLPVWYGNLPDETGQLLARWAGGWRVLTSGVLLAVIVVPFFLFFSAATKRRRVTLALGSAVVLLGLLGERFLLVLPALAPLEGAAGHAVGIGATAGVLGLFVLTVGARLGSAWHPSLTAPRGAPTER